MAKRVAVASLQDAHQKYLEMLNLTPVATSASQPPPKKLRCYLMQGNQVHIPRKFFDKLNLAVPFAVPPHVTGNPNDADKWVFTGQLRIYQIPVATECLKHLAEHASATLWLYPGFGKTAVGAFLAAQLPKARKLLVMVCRTALIESWAETFRQFTNSRVYIVPTGALDEAKLLLADVVICMNTRVSKLPLTVRHNIGTFILDEAHMFCETQARIETVLDILCDYVILETATYTRLSDMHRFLKLVAGTHYVRRDYPHAFTINKILVTMPISLHVPPGGNLMDIYRNTLISRAEYNQVILRRVRAHEGRKILIMTWLVHHLEILSDLFTSEGISHARYFGSQDSYVDSQVIVATLHKTGVGFDEIFKVMNYNGSRISVVILPLSIKDPNFFLQCLGRGMRAEDPMFDIILHDHGIAKRHWDMNQRAVRELPGFKLNELHLKI